MADTKFNESFECFCGTLWSSNGLCRCPWQKGGCQGFGCTHWSSIEWMLPQKEVPAARWLGVTKVVPVAALSYWSVCQAIERGFNSKIGTQVTCTRSHFRKLFKRDSLLSFVILFSVSPRWPWPCVKCMSLLREYMSFSSFCHLNQNQRESHIDFDSVAWLLFYWKTSFYLNKGMFWYVDIF